MIQVSALPEGAGWEFFDPIGNASVRVRAPTGALRREAHPHVFPVEVEAARGLRTQRLSVQRNPTVAIRDADGTVVETAYARPTRLSRSGPTYVELCTPVKLYVESPTGVDVEMRETGTVLEFTGDEPVRIGARVKQDRPDRSVEITEAIDDVFAAISSFGCLGHPDSPVVSFQSNRRHPPLIEFGSTTDIPTELQANAETLRLELPATYLHAAIGAPLAYYLGAKVVPGHPPSLVVDGEQLRTWGEDTAVQDGCARLLKRVLFLDCVARKQAGYDVNVTTRSAVLDEIDVDLTAFGDAGIAERLPPYLEIPWETIADHLPSWTGHAVALPNQTTIKTLPYLAYDLVPVYRAGPPTIDGTTSSQIRAGTSVDDGTGTGGRGDIGPLVEMGPPPFGGRAPVGSQGITHASLRNRTFRDADNESVSVAVICNDPKMLPERDSVESIYDSLAAPAVTVRRHQTLTREEMADVLSDQTDYLHFIGHIHGEGFGCADGELAADAVESVGAEVVFLNACQSNREGRTMIERGAVGGIVTSRPVANKGAIVAGRSIAELLIRGYPLWVALAIAQDAHPVCRDYTVIGDPRVEIANTESGVPYLCDVKLEEEAFAVTVRTVLTTSVRKGSLGGFHLGEDETFDLNPATARYHVDRDTLAEFLDHERVPVRWDGHWRWSQDCREDLLERGDTPGIRPDPHE